MDIETIGMINNFMGGAGLAVGFIIFSEFWKALERSTWGEIDLASTNTTAAPAGGQQPSDEIEKVPHGRPVITMEEACSGNFQKQLSAVESDDDITEVDLVVYMLSPGAPREAAAE